ncbi:MAG: hypothetical protein NT075_17575, partial [Chloroflexi bacterium]|nr:hypothetical protein [Chloroflexota bacterium]
TDESGAGVAAQHWRLNGGLWQAYTAPFVITNERVNLLEYQATDQAGNQAAPQFIVFSLDLQNPASQVAVLQGTSGNNQWFVTPVTLTLQAQDAESGLSGVTYQLDQTHWQTYTRHVALSDEGVHTVNYRARDASGRLEATHTLTVSIDLTPPQIQMNLPAIITDTNLTFTGLYSVTDAVSQVLTTTLLLNGQPYLGTRSFLLGENTLAITAVNGAGLAAQRTQVMLWPGEKIYLPIIQRKSQ